MNVVQRMNHYRELEGISQSFLKEILSTGGNVRKPKRSTFLEGDVFECLVLYPQHFDELYHVSDYSMEGKVATIIENMYAACENYFPLDQFPDSLIPFLGDYNANLKEATRVNKVIEQGSAYWQSLWDRNGKTVVPTKMFDYLRDQSLNLKLHEFFPRELLTFDVQTIIQTDLYGVRAKGLVDILELTDTYVQPYDLKYTSVGVDNFAHKIRQFRYDMQDAWYTMILKELYPYLEVRPMKFVVWNNDLRIITINERAREIAKYGITNNGQSGNGLRLHEVKIPGIYQAIAQYTWSEENNISYPQHVYLNKGNLTIDPYDYLFTSENS